MLFSSKKVIYIKIFWRLRIYNILNSSSECHSTYHWKFKLFSFEHWPVVLQVNWQLRSNKPMQSVRGSARLHKRSLIKECVKCVLTNQISYFEPCYTCNYSLPIYLSIQQRVICLSIHSSISFWLTEKSVACLFVHTHVN